MPRYTHEARTDTRGQMPRSSIETSPESKHMVPAFTADTLLEAVRLSPLTSTEKQHIQEALFSGNETDPAEREEIIRQRVERINQLVLYAAKTFRAPVQAYERANKAYRDNPSPENRARNQAALREAETAIMHFYLLTMPTLNPDIPVIRKAETTYPDLPQVCRVPDNPKELSIWNSQPNSLRFIHRSQLQRDSDSADPDVRSRSEWLLKDIKNWVGPDGLVLHTGTAAWGIEHLAYNIQQFLGPRDQGTDKSETPSPEDMARELDPDLMRIWLLFHDLGRLVTHDSFHHAAFSQLIPHLVGLDPILFKDFDAPTILLFDTPNPLMEPPNMDEDGDSMDATTDDVTSPMSQNTRKRVAFIDEALHQLQSNIPEGYFSGDANFNPLAVLLFWYIDAYTKLVNIGDHSPAEWDRLYPKEQHRSLFLRQPGDEGDFLAQRASHYLRDELNQLDSKKREELGVNADADHLPLTIATVKKLGLEPKKEEQALYYLRQTELARGIFEWLHHRLGMDESIIWMVFFNISDVSRALLDNNLRYQQRFFSADRNYRENPVQPPPQESSPESPITQK